MSDAEKRLRSAIVAVHMSKPSAREKRLNEAQAAVDALLAEHRAALASARAEALEEAALDLDAVSRALGGDTETGNAAMQHAKRVRALKSRPAEPMLPELKVREVLARRINYAASEGHGWVEKELQAVAESLGIACECSRPLAHQDESDCLGINLDAPPTLSERVATSQAKTEGEECECGHKSGWHYFGKKRGCMKKIPEAGNVTCTCTAWRPREVSP